MNFQRLSFRGISRGTSISVARETRGWSSGKVINNNHRVLYRVRGTTRNRETYISDYFVMFPSIRAADIGLTF